MWCGCGGDEVHGVGMIVIVQTNVMLELGALRDIVRQSPDNNLFELGAFLGLDAGALEKFPSIG